jgi:aspartate carbamoyltransferase catalytic subunit
MKTSEIRNAETSSEVKGESPEDTIRTFSSYVDIVVIRHREEGYAERSAWVLNRSRRPVTTVP